jgi:hypothetical protein
VKIDVEVWGEGTGKDWRGAHNGVRGDDVVVVRAARQVSNGLTNRTWETVAMNVDQKSGWRKFLIAGAAIALVAGMASTPPSAYAAGKISSDDETKWVSIGMGIRTEFVAQEHASANGGSYSNNFGIDNARIYINGQIHKYLKFEFNTECFNCSNSINTSGQGANSFGGNSNVGILDAIGKFEYNQYVNLWVGRLLVPGERGELNGPFYMAVYDGFKTPFNSADFSGNFGKGGAGLFGRDNGAVFWGQVDPGFGHLQYSVGVFTGLQSGAGGSFCTNAQGCGPNQQDSFLYAGRVTYNFLNPEKNPGYYTSGTYYGTAGDILALAVGVNHQKNGAGSFLHSADYTAFISDLLFEKPLANDMGVITVNAEYKQYFADYNPLAFTDSSGNFGMFNGHSYTGYALYLIPQEVGIGRFQPYARYTWIQPNQSTNRRETEAGVNYVIAGHNARVSAFWQYGDLQTKGINYAPGVTGDKVNVFKVALQIQY